MLGSFFIYFIKTRREEMSKKSKKRNIKRKRHQKKKKQLPTQKGNTQSFKDRLRFVAYMREIDAANFSGELCQRKIGEGIMDVKYNSLEFKGQQFQRVAIYASNINLCKLFKLVKNNIVFRRLGSQFCLIGNYNIVVPDNYPVVICWLHTGVIDQFRSDTKLSGLASSCEILFHTIPNTPSGIIVAEIYTKKYFREQLLKELKNSWVYEKWKKQFHFF